MVRESPTEIFKMRPVIPVEALADLRAHVGKKECLIHSILTPFGVGGGDLVSPIVARAKVIEEFSAELFGDAFVFHEV